MKKYDLSEIDLDSVKIVSVPKKLKDITDMYRACKFDEANALLEKFDKMPHQVSDIKAQLAFFSCDFDKAVEHIMDYYPFYGEWYSGNHAEDITAMLLYSLFHCSEAVREEALDILLYYYSVEGGLSNRRGAADVYSMYKDISAGKTEEYFKNAYAPPKEPLELNEVIDKHCRAANRDDYFTKPKDASFAIGRIYKYGRADDAVSLYERFYKSRELIEYERRDIIRAYQYLGEREKARKAVVDLVKYRWMPVEWTTVMPAFLFGYVDLWDLFDEELMREIYRTPKSVDGDTKAASENLEFSGSFDEIFDQAKKNSGAAVVNISKLSMPTGKVAIGDPLVYFGSDMLPYAQKFPKGEYDVDALIIDKQVAMVKVDITKEPAAVYRNALIGTESQAEIDELGEDEFFGFPVDGGMAAIADDKVKREFNKFHDKWHKKHKSEDFYNGFLAPLLEASAKEYPEHQSEYGDYIDFVIPDTEYHMPIFSSGYGDGYYPVYFGYDTKGKPCRIVIEFISFDNE